MRYYFENKKHRYRLANGTNDSIIHSDSFHDERVEAHYCISCGTEVFTHFEILFWKDRYTRKVVKTNQNELKCHECPLCGSPFSTITRDGYDCIETVPKSDGIPFNCFDVNELFNKMKTARNELYINGAHDTVESFSKNADLKHQTVNTLVPKAEEIALTPQALLSYLGHLLQLETGLYAIEQSLIELHIGKAKLREELLKDYSKVIKKAKSGLDSSKKDLSRFRRLQNTFIEVTPQNAVYPEKPIVPQILTFNETKPIEPIYQKAGLFNKKKIAAENEAKKQAYEAALAQYNQRAAAYQAELENYKKAFAQYEAKYSEWTSEVESLKIKAQSEYECAVAKKKEEYYERVAELRKKAQNSEAKWNTIMAGIANGGAFDNQAGMQLLSKEISEGEKLLESIISARNELYSYNVIYPKYRNFVALSSFYDYLMSGRCNALVGSDGAYNLYENESRADLIIIKLSDVLTSLDRIQENQYMLYQQMSDVNSGVKALNESMTSVVSSLAHLEKIGEEMKNSLESISSDTASMNKEVKSITKNVEINAHYSMVSAFYAKKNAELTDALGYMTAFK